MMLALLAVPFAFAVAVEPVKWERKSLDGAPVSVLVPKGSQPQEAGKRHPGFDEAAEGWQLQSTAWPDRGASRMILYLKRGDITVYYGSDDAEAKLRTLDDYVESETNGRKPEGEQYGKWKGFTVRLVALRDPNRHPAADAPFGDLAIHAVEFGPKEYLAIVLHAHPDAVQSYLPYFYKVRDSIRYSKKPPVLVAKSKKTEKPAKPEKPKESAEPKAPPPADEASLPPHKRLVLLPHLGRRTRPGANYYPYVRVLQCPQGFIPKTSDWPRAGSIVCRPVRMHSGQ